MAMSLARLFIIDHVIYDIGLLIYQLSLVFCLIIKCFPLSIYQINNNTWF